MQLNQIEKEFNINFYNNIMKKRVDFKNKKIIKNKAEKKIINFSSSAKHQAKKEYMFYNYNTIALNEQFANNNFVAFFITTTLKSSFHKYKRVGKINTYYINNSKFIESNIPNLGYKILNNNFRNICKNFRIKRQYQSVKYVKIIEHHKDNYTPHLHSICWVKKEYVSQFKQHLNNLIRKDQNIGLNKIEQLKDTSRASAYILKYIKKNFASDTYKNYYGWRLRHNITRAFTFSKTYINRDIFDKLSWYFLKDFVKHNDTFEQFATTNYYELVSKFTTIKTEILDIATGEIITKTNEAQEDNIFQVLIYKEKSIISEYHKLKVEILQKLSYQNDISIINSKLKEFKYFNNFNFFCIEQLNKNISQINHKQYYILLDVFLNKLQQEYRYQYKIINYKIYKKQPCNMRYDLVFDKKDWQITNK